MIKSLDHVAVPMENVAAMTDFYRQLGCRVTEEFDGHVQCVAFGDNKINFHAPSLWREMGFSLRGHGAVPGCGDFCFVWDGSSEDLLALLTAVGAEVEDGPVQRSGGRGQVGTSVYVRDPDTNLLEFMIY